MKYKILNLYACFGGNRYKWDEVADIEVTAVELDQEAARLYQERFPNDIVIVADAHQYLLDHYREFNFIWSSPPCPTHSRVRYSQKNREAYKSEYPNMMLYQEIIFLQHHFKGKFCIENVIPYYEPLIAAQQKGRHLYWCNFILPNNLNERKISGIIGSNSKNEFSDLCKLHDYDFSKYKGEQLPLKMARNLVDFEVGKKILERALNIQKENDIKQQTLFES